MATAPIVANELPAQPLHPALAWAHPVVQEWFVARFGTPTEPQIAGWPTILRGEPTLISAPTGSGKTLTAFLVAIDRLLRASIEGRLAPQTQVVYCSPLKALSNDVQKNLDGPLREIQQLAIARGYLCGEIRTGVRTGDTLARDRAAMLKHPPHILVTTPESLYILLTAGKSRQNLTRVETVIVDEIHAIADDKRGAHLALTLERLDALVRGENRLAPGAMLTGLARAPQRIGLSATQNPIELVASFLTGVDAASPVASAADAARRPSTIVQVGQRRELDLAIEVPSDALSAVTTIPMWQEIYDKLAALAEQHRSTLVFVNTRRLVEKLSFELAERLGPDAVAAHHGSLSRALRLDAEQRLKNGEIRILIATASLELGIDIGSVDLVCQIASTRSVSVAMQRVGRAGHWRGAVPKGRFFATTRDDLMEQAALIRNMRAGVLDQLEIPAAPADVLMQQIVAAVGAESWEEDALYRMITRAWPYRAVTRTQFDELVALLHNGIESSRGRYGAYLLRDRVQGQLHARRGARAIAIANGGAIPDTAIFAVMLQPENVQIATLDEHFAVDSSPGDVVLLGNTSWRIQRVESQGKVHVEDAHGAPPSIPFWEGEAPQRTGVLSAAVSELRAELDERMRGVTPAELRSPTHDDGAVMNGPPGGVVRIDAQRAIAETATWLCAQCGVCSAGARQLIAYIVEGRAVLGAVPTQRTLIAERFFDEGGGQQLILHAPFGGRLNKAWGLALRKRFCRGFNFELQAAATDNGINISLAEQHSFPLAEVFRFLSEHTARNLLEQACIPSPLFKNRWRWAAGRSLQLLRMQRGKRVAPQIQRTRSDDLLASVFPHASACPETMTGDIEIPDHPLVREVMHDTLTEAMDIDGLEVLLRAIAAGEITIVAVDTPVPSVFAHELIHAMPYAFLDEAGLEERRARTVNTRGALPSQVNAGLLDPAAIESVRAQLWPDVRDAHELHDLLLQVTALPLDVLAAAHQRDTRHWPQFFAQLAAQGRAHEVELVAQGDDSVVRSWVASERIADAALLWPGSVLPAVSLTEDERACTIGGTEERPKETMDARASAALRLVQGWLQLLGPSSAAQLAELTGLHPRSLLQSLLAMELQGIALRGVYEHAAREGDSTTATVQMEWCERRILQRIHRLTVSGRRRQVEPVAPTQFMHWLARWQHVAPGAQLRGEEGVLAALEQLEGFEAPAIEWERTLLPARVAEYDPQWLDNLCLAGVVAWGRVSPHPAWSSADASGPRRVVPTSAAPITFYIRESAEWLHHALAEKRVEESVLAQALSPEAQRVRAYLAQRGAAFAAEMERALVIPKLAVATALWELATAGLASADGFDPMRALMDPRRKAVSIAQKPATSLRKRAAARTTAGRWSLLQAAHVEELATTPEARQQAAMARARQADAALESHARVLLARYGVVFRELLTREQNAPRWRDLAQMLRRLEDRGEVRGGRFIAGAFGEQFALPEAVEGLRAMRRSGEAASIETITLAAADLVNLAGIVVPGERVPALPGRTVELRGGAFQVEEPAVDVAAPKSPRPVHTRSVQDVLRAEGGASAGTRAAAPATMNLFQ